MFRMITEECYECWSDFMMIDYSCAQCSDFKADKRKVDFKRMENGNILMEKKIADIPATK